MILKITIGELVTVIHIIMWKVHIDGPPLIKVQYESNKIYALIKTDASGNNEAKVLISEIDDDEKFVLRTTVFESGNLRVYFNGEAKTVYPVGNYWGDYYNYFKAGNYLQSNDDDSYAYVHLYTFGVYTRDSACDLSSSSFTAQSNVASSASSISTIIAAVVCILAIVIIGGGIFGYRYWKKNESPIIITKEEVKDVEVDDDINANACDTDTPVVNMDGDGLETPDTKSTNSDYEEEVIQIETRNEDVNDE